MDGAFLPMQPQDISVPCSDGLNLGVTLIEAMATAVRGVVLIHPATAVPQRLYASFARGLAEHGYHAVVYDYRGIGRSRPASLRGFHALMSDWADHDVETITDWARQRWPELPLFAVGHSFGGHAIGLCQASRHLTGGVMIASHAGCLRFIRPTLERWRATLMLRAISPVAVGICGYLPGSKLGIGEDLPAGVIRQWGWWTGLPRYFFDDPAMNAANRFASVTCPVLNIGLEDDPWATRGAVDLMADYFTGTSVERRWRGPADSGGTAIGHLGYFRRQHQDTLWPEVFEWLDARVASVVSAR